MSQGRLTSYRHANNENISVHNPYKFKDFHLKVLTLDLEHKK